ncbi:MAG: hypothetical protein CBC35_03105 [Planctomycetes bacterium TMED75]|nr:hypothetical protein [Planctomycetaceae bacterium]OUU95012.1 MAG: hypothetical protein CBC35_03105 [Planctomycetes bacterium TMED75]
MQKFHNTTATIVIALCRVGALLAILQMAAWVGGVTDSANQPVVHDSTRMEAGLRYLESVGDSGAGILASMQPRHVDPQVGDFESLMILAREVSRTLLWVLAFLALPLGLLLGLSSPFVRQADSYRMLFGAVALLGLVPLARSESMPMPWVAGGSPYLPESLLAGGAVPLVAALLLGSAAILFDQRRLVPVDPRNSLSPAASLSSSDVNAIIKRGEPCRIRSNRLRRTMQ